VLAMVPPAASQARYELHTLLGRKAVSLLPARPLHSLVYQGSTAGGAKDPETFLKVGRLAPSAPLPPMRASGGKS
jgi:hypothetical protein